MEIKRILIIRPSSLGNVMHALMVTQTIRDHFPETEIDFLVSDRFAPIVEHCKAVDNLIIFKRKGGPLGFCKLLREIRRKRYDAVLDIQAQFRTGLMVAAARSKLKIGRKDAREGSGIFCNRIVDLPPNPNPHQVDTFLQFLPALGKPAKLGSPVAFDTPPLDTIEPALTETPPILLLPHSRGKEKEWPHFRELTQRILKEMPGQNVVWDSHIAIPSQALENEPCFFNTTGKTSIPEMISLIKGARVVIANDTGPMHIAAALAKPTIALFGPTKIEKYGAYPLDSPRNANIQSTITDWSDVPVDRVFDTLCQLVNL
ncbi:MAG: glycosyltransferase family 9 protein [Verrucomicrobia bacterium]|nr:glycosyltransferase family 9 protein [Verrucomicrobiota bacterium]